MVRLILWLIGAVVAISFLRGVVGIFGRAVGNHMGGTPNVPPTTPVKAALKKCASCGVYAPSHAKLQRGGETLHFCSADCLRKTAA